MDFGNITFKVVAGDYITIPRETVHAITASIPMKVLSIQTPQWVAEDRTFVSPLRRPHNE
jgi:mannose-6-phosphate isomerase-like protein (cupin superfamily)